METSCLEASLGAKRPRLSQGRSLGPAAQLYPVSWFTPKHGIPKLSHQLNPFFDSVFQHPDPRYSTSARETGLLRLIPLPWQLASPQPNTPQFQQAPLTVQHGVWGLDLPQFSLSLSQGAPGEARQAYRRTQAEKSLPQPLPLVHAHSRQASPAGHPSLLSSISPVTAAGQARWGDPCPAGSGLSLPHWGWGQCSDGQRR